MSTVISVKPKRSWYRRTSDVVLKSQRIVRSKIEVGRFVAGSYVSVLVAAVLAVGTALGANLGEPWNSWLFWLGIITAILTVVLKTGLLVTRHRSGKILIAEPKGATSPLVRPAWTSDTGRSQASQWSSGPMATIFWDDPKVNNYLRTLKLRHECLVTSVAHKPVIASSLRSNDYRLPRQLELLAPAILRLKNSHLGEGTWVQRFLKRPTRFNGHMMRLASEPTLQQLQNGTMQLQHVRYFSGECSNEAWGYELKANGTQSKDLIKSFTYNQADQMKALYEAETANIVGVTVVAITSDDKIVLVRQGARNTVAGNEVAVAGSGSITRQDLTDYLHHHNAETGFWADLKRRLRLVSVEDSESESIDFLELLWWAMSERVCTETAVNRNLKSGATLLRTMVLDPESFVCTGYFRWISRAAKPEFSGLVRLRVTAEEVVARFTSHLTLDSDEVVTVSLSAGYRLCEQGVRGENKTSESELSLIKSVSPSSEYALLAAMEYIKENPDWIATPLK